ncbi:MAG: hypothetical protein ACXWBP_09495 [Limisphaerales bacterium]
MSTEKYTIIAIFLVVALVHPTSTQAGSRSSANYLIPADSVDASGAVLSSANYMIKGTGTAEFGAGSNALTASTDYTNKGGFVGELYDIVGLSITAPPSNNLNETASRQLAAAPLADDTTTLTSLDPSTVNWSIVSGPVNSISTSGLATAGNVYQDTLATVGGAAQSLSGQLNLTILNVTNDDFGPYANDGIDDSWQVQYFGQPPNPLAEPNADADGTGQTHLFKFVAGLNPVDGSRFTLSIQQVSGQPAQKKVIFQPLVSGRTYAVQFRSSLTSGTWGPLTGTTQSDNGSTRTVTDLNASAAPKLYQVQITKP